MLKYDFESNILYAKREDGYQLYNSIKEDQYNCYMNYVNKVVKEDIEFATRYIAEKLVIDDLRSTCEVKPLRKNSVALELKNEVDKYYPVEVSFYRGFYPDPIATVQMLRIPFMGKDCILNCGGKRRVLMPEMKSAEEISYDASKETLSITTPERNISVIAKENKKVNIKFGTNNFDILDLILAMCYEKEIDIDLDAMISNTYLKRCNPGMRFRKAATGEKVASKLRETYNRSAYKLGPTRERLNEVLSDEEIYLNKTLSRPVLDYPKGTKITLPMVRAFKKNRINSIYVECKPKILGLITKLPLLYDLTELEVEHKELLRFPYVRNNTIKNDDRKYLFIKDGTVIDEQLYEVLMILKPDDLVCFVRKNEEVTVSFECEIIGNYMAQLGELVDEVPEGRSYSEWVYYKDNPALLPMSDDTFNSLNEWDLLAIFSMIGRMAVFNENLLLNKDTAFLKRICMVDKTFSNYFRTTFTTEFRESKIQISKLFSGSQKNDNPFSKLTRKWISNMWDGKILVLLDSTNSISMETLVSRIAIIAQSSRQVARGQRLLAMSYGGRIDPYETPAGGKLGLLNTRATGSRIQDGVLKAPYFKILKTSEGKKVSSEITYLDVKEEINLVIGDRFNIDIDENGYIRNLDEIVVAKCPSTEDPTERNQIKYVKVDDIEYINVSSEQNLAPTTRLVPFFSMNDAIRGTYATNMFKAAIFAQKAEKPDVITDYYHEMFDGETNFVKRSPISGIVTDITTSSIFVMDINSGKTEEVEYAGSIITGDSITFTNLKVKPGDVVKKNQIIVDSTVAIDGCFSPGRNAFVAYIMTGYNYEDAVDMTVDFAYKLSSIKPEVSKITIPASASLANMENASEFKYVEDNDSITEYTATYKGNCSQTYRKKIKVKNVKGIFFHMERCKDDKSRTSKTYNCYILGLDEKEVGDKIAGRHANKGVTSKIRRSSEAPCFKNGVPIDIQLNPLGVPSRRNIGQMGDSHLGFISYILGVQTESGSFNCLETWELRNLMQYTWDCCNLPIEEAISKHPEIPKELHDHVRGRVDFLAEWKDCFLPNGDAILWDPITGTYFEFPITVGRTHILKLKQQVSTKFHVRGGIFSKDINYMAQSYQPAHGGEDGGQAITEMELWALLVHGCSELITEIINEDSDNAGLRLQRAYDILRYEDSNNKVNPRDMYPRFLETFAYLCEAAGVTIDSEHMPPLSDNDSWLKKSYEIDPIKIKKDTSREDSAEDILNELESEDY